MKYLIFGILGLLVALSGFLAIFCFASLLFEAEQTVKTITPFTFSLYFFGLIGGVTTVILCGITISDYKDKLERK